MNDRELKINRLAQGMDPLESGIEWFKSGSDLDRKEILKTLDVCIFQSHPTKQDIEKGIKVSGLKSTYSPCVMVLKKPFNEARQKVLNSQGIDQERSFKLFLCIFASADKRRRESDCINGCTHDWHNLEKS